LNRMVVKSGFNRYPCQGRFSMILSCSGGMAPASSASEPIACLHRMICLRRVSPDVTPVSLASASGRTKGAPAFAPAAGGWRVASASAMTSLADFPLSSPHAPTATVLSERLITNSMRGEAGSPAFASPIRSPDATRRNRQDGSRTHSRSWDAYRPTAASEEANYGRAEARAFAYGAPAVAVLTPLCVPVAAVSQSGSSSWKCSSTRIASCPPSALGEFARRSSAP
jgi:hypothetical protein